MRRDFRSVASRASKAPASSAPRHRRLRSSWVGALLFLATSCMFIWQAWISDDAYISFRTVENFVEGHGLVWNLHERVQAFTHPLWLLLLGVFCFFTGEYYLTPVLLSLALSILSMWLLLRLSPSSAHSKAAALLALGLSVAFVSYTTSGLENALTFLLLGLFLGVFWSPSAPGRRLLFLGLLGSLAMVNRLDNVFLFGIPMLYAFWEARTWKARRLLLIGCTPIIAWLAFALVYYGAIIPNCAIAKLYTGIPQAEYVKQGLVYFGDALRYEPLTLIGVLWGVAAAFWRRGRELVPLGIAMVTFLLYVVWVGGDFMRGRFLTAPFFVSLAILMRTNFLLPKGLLPGIPFVVVLLAVPTLNQAFLVEPHNRARHDAHVAKTGICDERAYYLEYSGLTRRPLDDQVGHNMQTIRQLRASDPTRLRVVSVAGQSGFMSGPTVYVVDSFALTNPLLSRIAIREDRKWRIGHFERRVPEGYLSALLGVGSTITNPAIADLHTRIESVARGKLFSPDRWKHILQLNSPFAKKVYALPQKEFVEPRECVALARSKLEILDLELLWGAAQFEIQAGNRESAERILKRLLWIVRENRRSLLSSRDFVQELIGVANEQSAERFEDSEALLLLAIEEMPVREEPLLALSDLYDRVGRGTEAAALRERAMRLQSDHP